MANFIANTAYAPFAAPWNMVGWPAASIPVGLDTATGLPLAVQAVVQPGNEKRLLSLAAQLERVQPWPLLTDEPAAPSPKAETPRVLRTAATVGHKIVA